ncbi:MAG TPA: transglycosylase SLT domain-containing protein [Myxococcota bacterium]|nr:transglycosylase SLT domain-containing protein [Myxococcota bacterium]
MAARLVELRNGRTVTSRRLQRRELVLGRDPGCDWVVDDARVSREHARIAPGEGEHVLEDLGSRNGTRVNGQPVAGAVVLRDGDLVDLGSAVTLRYELGAAPRRQSLALEAAALGVVLVAGGIFWALHRDPVMDQAVIAARAALAASERGDAAGARDLLGDAVARLYREGRLEDVPRLHAREEGLRRIGRALGGDIDLVALYRAAVERGRARQVASAVPERGPCRLDEVGADDLGVCVRERSEQVLVGLWQDPAKVPDSFYRSVQEQMLVLLNSKRGWVEASIARGRKLEPMIVGELNAAKVPPLLRYLAMIESGYNPGAQSGAGARGLWQFIPSTAQRYGLVVRGGVDERLDPAKATRAAAHYLNDLAFEFGDEALLLAIASYNKGENGIRGALRKLDDPRTERSYWVLAERGLLPDETRDYVPRLIAAAVLGEAGLPSDEALSRARASAAHE